MVDILTSKLNMSQDQLSNLLNEVLNTANATVNPQQQQVIQALNSVLAKEPTKKEAPPPPPVTQPTFIPPPFVPQLYTPQPPPPVHQPMYTPPVYIPQPPEVKPTIYSHAPYDARKQYTPQPPPPPVEPAQPPPPPFTQQQPPPPIIYDNRNKRSFTSMDRPVENDAKRTRYTPPPPEPPNRPKSPPRYGRVPSPPRNAPRANLRNLALTVARNENMPDQRYIQEELGRYGRIDDVYFNHKLRKVYVTFKTFEEAERAKFRLSDSRIFSATELCDSVERNGETNIVYEYGKDGGASPPPSPPPAYLIGL
jgi:hypothetical protein